jgi:hypothetical protein
MANAVHVADTANTAKARTLLLRARGLGVLLAAILGALACSGCSGAGPGWRVDRQAAEEVTQDGLWPVRFGGFRRVWLDPDESFTDYTSLWIAPPKVYYERMPTPRDRAIVNTGVRSDSPNVPLSAQQQSDFRRYIVECFARELAKSRHFELVEAPGEGTLVVAPDIHDLVMLVPLAPLPGSRYMGTHATAEMTLVLELRDAATARPVARVAEWRQAVTPGNAGTLAGHDSVPAQNVAALRHTFCDWAWQLRMRLDDTRTRAERVAAAPASGGR